MPLFAVIVLFSLDYLNWPLFLLIFYAVSMRIFIGNHDRYYADQRTRLPRFFEIISENLAVVVTPWDEPYNSIRKKHLRHHATHSQGKSSGTTSAIRWSWPAAYGPSKRPCGTLSQRPVLYTIPTGGVQYCSHMYVNELKKKRDRDQHDRRKPLL